MLESLAHWALKRWFALPFLALALLLLGAYAFANLTIEAFPDPTDPQVEVITQFPGQSTEEVERQIGIPLERALNDVPGLIRMRNMSFFGLSNIKLTFVDHTNLGEARELVLEHLRDLALPDGVTPALGPLATPVGEIYRYTLTGAQSDLLKLREIQDYVIRPALMRVPGVADDSTFGGLVEEIHVVPSPARMAACGVTFAELQEALKKASVNASGGMLERGAEGLVITSSGSFHSPLEIGEVGVVERQGTPVLVRQIAEVSTGWAQRQGVASRGKQADVVVGIVVMRRGENPSKVLAALRQAIDELNRTLPDGVQIVPFDDRTALVNRTLTTVSRNMLEGAVLVVVVLWVFLMNFRAALIVGTLIPLSLGVSFIYLYFRGMSANLLSMGAVDFGIIVDGGVVIVEAILLRLQCASRRGEPLLASIELATKSVLRPTVFSLGIIMAAYLPIFMLERVEGRVFSPMAHTVVSALAGALLLSITLVPALALWVYRARPPVHHESPVLRWAKRAYEPALHWCLAKPVPVLASVSLLVATSLALLPRLGSEFLPALNEGSLYLTFTLPQNVSVREGRRMMPRIQAVLSQDPAVAEVLMALGRPEDGTTPNLPNNLECFVKLKPPEQWGPEATTMEQLVGRMQRLTAGIPGADVTFSQPIADNVNDSLSGQPGDIACKLFGPDLDQLQQVAERWKAIVAGVPGVADLGIVKCALQPQLQVRPDREALARMGLPMEDLQHTLGAALGGLQTGTLWRGEVPVPVMLRLPEPARNGPATIRKLLVPTPGGQAIELQALAQVTNGFGRASITRERGRRYIGLRMDVRGRDLGSFVEECMHQTLAHAPLPPGVTCEWGGSFESKERAMKRLKTLVPVTLALTLLLLFSAFDNLGLALVVMLGVPLALVGGVFGLYAAHLPLSVAAAVGFIALIGQASLNGVLLLSAIQARVKQGIETHRAIVEGCLERLRAVLMTGCLAALGLVPAALSHEMGAETQQPIAVVVVGGTLSAMGLTLLVLPVLYSLLERLTRNAQRGEANGPALVSEHTAPLARAAGHLAQSRSTAPLA